MIWIRSRAEDIFKGINENVDKIIVDFKDVKFMDRAFTHEYYRQRKKQTAEIVEINKKYDVEKMIEIVIKS